MDRVGTIRTLLSVLFVGMSNAWGLDSCKYSLRANFVALAACPNQDVGLSNISLHEHDNVRWTWFFGDNRESDEFSPILSYPTGNAIYTITLKAYDSTNGCRDSVSKWIKIYANPNSEFKTFIKVVNGCYYRQFAAYKTNPIEHSFYWFLPNEDSIYITGTNYFSIPDTLTIRKNTVKLRVRSNLGCVSETEQAYNLLDINDITLPYNYISNYNPSRIEIETVEDTKIQLYDGLGKLRNQFDWASGYHCIENLEPGIYYLYFTSSSGFVHSYKTIVY